MPLWSKKSTAAPTATVTLDEVMTDNEVLYVSDIPGQQFMVVAPKGNKGVQLREQAPLGELGSSSSSPWTSFTRREYNSALEGIRGLEKYDKMRKSDGAVRGTLRLIKTPVLGARWFMEAGGDRSRDKLAADLVWRNLTEYMSVTWSQLLTECLLMLDFGYYMFEKVYERRLIDGTPRIVWKKLAPRHPMDVKEWVFDENGGPSAVAFYPPTSTVGGTFGLEVPNGLSGMNQDIVIPISKLAVFTFDREAGNIEGISVLRSAYKHWYYKEQMYKIDAIQKERHGIGIPVIKLPMNYSGDDKRVADELGRNLRTNERAHIVLPPGWEVLMLKLEGQPVDCLKSIAHHNEMIYQNILGAFILTASDSSRSSSAVDLDLFLKATRFVADIIAETFNHYLIPQLVDFNFTNAKYPKLRVRRIGEQADWRTLSFALRNLIGASVIKPDAELERVMREEMDLPKSDPDTVREAATPQLPRVGPPRQTTTQGMQNQVGLPAPNAGDDTSGG